MTPSFKLFYAPGTCALAPHIALEEAGVPFEAVRVDTAGGAQRQPEYLALNPKGRVPLLVVDGQALLTETPAILAYIAQRFPAARLAPLDDPLRFAQAQSFNSYLCSTVHVAHAHGPRGARWADDPAAIAAMKRKVPQTMGDCFALIEGTVLGDGPWVLGAEYSMCDPYLFTMCQWLAADGVDVAGFPKVQAHVQRMAERPAVQRALARERATV